VTTETDAIRFAERLLALLDEGSFTATYKFAVLLGLMDLCLEYSDRFGEPPPMVTTTQLAGKVIELYWPQTTPFEDTSGDVLRQNTGREAVILQRIRTFRHAAAPDPGCSLHRARLQSARSFSRLVDDVEWTLVLMPLPKLQRFGGADNRFIYEIEWDDSITRSRWRSLEFDNRISFVGAAAHHLVRLSPLLRPLIQQNWTEMVGRLNDLDVARLESFLFGADRVSLQPVRKPLTELQHGACFYCGRALRSPGDVDHFLPWSRYPDDRLDNLVVTHSACNRLKRDFLASAPHVARWAQRLSDHDRTLSQIADAVAWPRNTPRSLNVIRTTYFRLPDGVALWDEDHHFTPSNHGDLVNAFDPLT